MDTFISYTFEDVCRQYLCRANMHGALPFHFSRIGRWWNKSDGIDVMAVNKEGTSFIVGECKFKNSVFGISDFEHMRNKFKPSKKESGLYIICSQKADFRRR